MPKTQECYDNVKLLLDEVDISRLESTLSCDLKCDFYICGKMTASCKHPCIFCPDTAPYVDENAKLLTIGDLKKFLAGYQADPNNPKNTIMLSMKHFCPFQMTH